MGQLKRQLLMWGAIATTTAVLPGLALAENVGPEHGGGRYGGDRHGRSHGHDDAKLSVAGRAISRGTTDSYGLQIRGRSEDQPTDADGMIRFAHRGKDVMEGLVGEITCLSKDSAGVVSVTGTIHRSGKRAKGEKGNNGEGDKTMPSAPGAPTAPGTPALPTSADADADTDAETTAFLDEIVPWEGDEAAEPVHGRDGRGRRAERGDRRGGGELAGKDFALTISTAGKPQKFSQPTIGEHGTLTACSGGGAPTAEVTRGGFRVREADAESDDTSDSDGKGQEDRKREGRRGRGGLFR